MLFETISISLNSETIELFESVETIKTDLELPPIINGAVINLLKA